MLLSMTQFKTESNSVFLNVLNSPGFGILGVNSQSEVLTAEMGGPILRVLLNFKVQIFGLKMDAELGNLTPLFLTRFRPAYCNRHCLAGSTCLSYPFRSMQPS